MTLELQIVDKGLTWERELIKECMPFDLVMVDEGLVLKRQISQMRACHLSQIWLTKASRWRKCLQISVTSLESKMMKESFAIEEELPNEGLPLE